MAEFQSVFKRYEKKYMINEKQRSYIISAAGDYIEKDKFYLSTVCSIYYDTPSKLLIRNSIDKPEYKEKIRLRSYGVPTVDDKVFLELKKKYHGVVYKRRISIKLSEVEDFLKGKLQPKSQIEKELAWALSYYGDIKPSVFIGYDRTSFCGAEDKTFRLTFDTNVIYRKDALELSHGLRGDTLIADGIYIMEVKSPFAMPLWLSRVLDDLKIYPTSFSKYGTVYKNSLDEQPINFYTLTPNKKCER